MRLWYPLNDTPVFVLPAVSIRDYDWGRKSVPQKCLETTFGIMLAAGFGYFVLSSAAHRSITWNDLTWTLAAGLLKCLFIIALFPAIIFSVVAVFLRRQPPYEPQSTFYREWARIYTGMGKGKHVLFFVEDVARFRVEQAVYREQPFYLVTVSFRQGFLNRRRDERCGFRVEKESELDPFLEWADENQIGVDFQASNPFAR